MASFLRSVLQVLLGFALGFAVATYYLPSTNASKGPSPGPRLAGKPATGAPAATDAGNAPSGDSLFGRPAGSSAQAVARAETPADPAPAPAPREPAEAPREPEPRTETPVVAEREPAPAVAEEPVDFRELCIKPAAWPPIITLNKEINAQVMQGEEVIAEIPLAAGERLQVSKVFGDATAEVRAKGAKFIVKAADTDLAAQARVRLAEISGRVRAPAPTAVPAPAAPVAQEPPAKPAAPAPSQPARGDDLDSKMRSLFGTPQKR